MEKALYELTIDPEFRDLIPPLTPSDYENLAESIAKDGCEDDLIVWDGVIIDGHNRYRICHALGIPFSYREKEFSSREEAKMWMIQRSFGRRNMSKYDKAVLALRYEAVLREEAEVRMKSGIKADPLPNSEGGSEKGYTVNKIADLAGVGKEYIYRVKKIEEVADEATKAKLSRGETTVNKVYTRLFPKKKEDAEILEDEDVESPGPEISTSEDDRSELGISDINGFVCHTGNNPSSFEPVRQELELATSNFILSLQDAMERYTRAIASSTNSRTIEKMLEDTLKEARKTVKAHLKEVAEDE